MRSAIAKMRVWPLSHEDDADAGQGRAELVVDQRREAMGHLVEEQTGLAHQGAADGHSSLLASGEPGGPAGAAVGDERHHHVHLLQVQRAFAASGGAGPEALLVPEGREEPLPRWDEADVLCGSGGCREG
ncbi:hypothetical protein ACFY3G_47765 [Streptomyces phaeochromogenes]|uniref:hypothetical protein n=1 Tax=Streptomyces phaeochromogenes TaxID=1923 RepID=UPI0036986451